MFDGLNASFHPDSPPDVCYKFLDSFLNELVVPLLKDFVGFHMKRIYPKLQLEENKKLIKTYLNRLQGKIKRKVRSHKQEK